MRIILIAASVTCALYGCQGCAYRIPSNQLNINTAESRSAFSQSHPFSSTAISFLATITLSSSSTSPSSRSASFLNLEVMTISLVASQILAAAFLFITTIACGVCPAWIGHYVMKRRKSKRQASCSDSHSCVECPEDTNELQDGNQLGQKTLSFLMNFGGKCHVCLLIQSKFILKLAIRFICRRCAFCYIHSSHASGSQRKL